MAETLTDFEALRERVMLSIRREKTKTAAIRRLLLLSVSWAASIIVLVPLWTLLMREAASSGFPQFARLMFTDVGAVLANWQDYLITLLETLPALSLAAVIAESLLALWLAKSIFASGYAIWTQGKKPAHKS